MDPMTEEVVLMLRGEDNQLGNLTPEYGRPPIFEFRIKKEVMRDFRVGQKSSKNVTMENASQ